MRFLRCGDSGILIELDTLDAVLALHAALAHQPLDGVTDMVPAAQTLLLRLGPKRVDPLRIERQVRATQPASIHAGDSETLVVPIRYDGPDLAGVAALIGLTEDQIIAAHTATSWRVAFIGFAPGFAYLTDGDPRLRIPRATNPRTKVPAGAVGLAGSFSAIYPGNSPGGWQLIGHTDLPIWRSDRTPPALLRPNMRVVFEETR